MDISKIAWKRGIAFYVDLAFSTAISMLLFLYHSQTYVVDSIPYIVTVGGAMLLCRDVFGRSLGKLIMGLQIIDTKTNSRANFGQRLLRNITTPFSIVEMLIYIYKNDNKRLGDMLAGTSVEEIKK